MVRSWKSIESFALNGRQFWQLTALTLGATYTPGGQQIGRGGAGVCSSSVNININGATSTFTGWLLDGSDITDFEAGGTTVQINVDALQEFKVVSATMPADYGHTPALVSATLKSGSNKFHGEVLDVIRNDYFDARNYFTRGRKNALRRNQFGGTLDGPVWRGRLFFFVDIERTIQTADNVFIARETKRTMDDVKGKCRIYPGIDIDVPTTKGQKKTTRMMFMQQLSLR